MGKHHTVMKLKRIEREVTEVIKLIQKDKDDIFCDESVRNLSWVVSYLKMTIQILRPND